MYGYSVYTVTQIFLEFCNNMICLMTNMNNRTGIWQLLAYSVIQLLEMEIVSLEQSAFPCLAMRTITSNLGIWQQTLRGNIDIFRDYFIDGPGTAEEQIDHFGQPSTYAGQECILALAMALNRNIMVTVGGDLNNRVATYENSFTPDQAHPHIHIIWHRAGGGHYESVTEQQQSLSFFPRNDPIVNKDNSRTKL